MDSGMMLTGAGLFLAGALAGWLSGRITAAFATHPDSSPLLDRKSRALALPTAGALLGGFAALWCAWLGYSPVVAMFTALLAWQLLLIAVVDAENFWLPDRLTLPLFATGIMAHLILPSPPAFGWVMALVSAIAAFAGLWLMAGLYRLVRKRKAIGTGDPILLGAGCAWVGIFDVMHVLLIASLAGLVVVVARKISDRPVRGDTRLPFGSLLAIGLFVCWLPF